MPKDTPQTQYVSARLDSTIVGGVITLICFLIFIILWDDYIFYKATYRRVEKKSMSEVSSLSSSAIDKTITMLNERQQKFDDLKSGK